MHILSLCLLLLLFAFSGALHWGRRYDRRLQFSDKACISSQTTSSPVLLKKTTAAVGLASILLVSFPSITYAKDPLPTLDKIFAAVRKEISPEGESIARLREDINKEKWEDILTYTREYDAGFRGGVLKAAWKQLGTHFD